MRSAAQLIIPIIVPRAMLLWGLVRLAVAMLPLAADESFGSMPAPPVAVILLTCVVGLIDVRVRGERVLWANLAVTPLAICAVYAAAAIPCELILAFVF